MLFSYLFFYTFACFGILSSFMIVVTKNPIFSVLFLILTFFNVSSLLLLIEIDFLPIVFLIVYVGAVAILFLFVLMMLNIKISELKENTNHFIPIAMFLFVIFFFELFAVFYFEFTVLNFQKVHVEILDELCLFLNSSFEFHSWVFKQSNVFFIGELLFTNFSYLFLTSAFILLLAMVGVIILTLQKRFISRSQSFYKQILRRSNESIKVI